MRFESTFKYLIYRTVWPALLAGAMLLSASGCAGEESPKQAHVKGKITVADSVDDSGDYSNIGITIVNKDSANADADTLFHALTVKDGSFSGVAHFPGRKQYPIILSRNNRNLGQAGVILAENDSVNVTAELPGIRKTLQIHSAEHDALEAFQRVDKNFQRVLAYGRAGRLTGDSLSAQLQNWPNLYWQVYEEHHETLAGQLAAKKSIELLSEFDRPGMMEKISQIEENDDLVYLAATYGKIYTAENENLGKALSYLQSLESKTEARQARMQIQMERINLLYDSLETEKARTALGTFKQEFADSKVAQNWAASVEYDLDYLLPGDPIPEFSFNDSGKSVSRENLKGRAYLLEITALSNPIYQQQFDRTVVIHSLYKNYNFEIVTIPLDTSQVTVDAFFSERRRPWPVAPANAFATRNLIKNFNIQNLPVRFLVDKQGRIVRRFKGREYEEVIQYIQQTMNTN